jgi:hypothetical protein
LAIIDIRRRSAENHCKTFGGFAMDSNQHDEEVDPTGDLAVGADDIRAYLVSLGMPPSVDVYYLKRTGRWPIGSTAASGGGKLLASKRRLARHVMKLARGGSTAAIVLVMAVSITWMF